MMRDAEDPGVETGSAPEVARRAPHSEEDLLQEVLDSAGIAFHLLIEIAPEPRPVARVEPLQSSGITPGDPADQTQIVLSIVEAHWTFHRFGVVSASFRRGPPVGHTYRSVSA